MRRLWTFVVAAAIALAFPGAAAPGGAARDTAARREQGDAAALLPAGRADARLVRAPDGRAGRVAPSLSSARATGALAAPAAALAAPSWRKATHAWAGAGAVGRDVSLGLGARGPPAARPPLPIPPIRT
jgi:hypothetical protein